MISQCNVVVLWLRTVEQHYNTKKLKTKWYDTTHHIYFLKKLKKGVNIKLCTMSVGFKKYQMRSILFNKCELLIGQRVSLSLPGSG